MLVTITGVVAVYRANRYGDKAGRTSAVMI